MTRSLTPKGTVPGTRVAINVTLFLTRDLKCSPL